METTGHRNLSGPNSRRDSRIPCLWGNNPSAALTFIQSARSVRISVGSNSLWATAHQDYSHGLPTRLLCPWGSPQEYWGGLPFPSPGDLPVPGGRTQVSGTAGRFFTNWPPGKAQRAIPETLGCYLELQRWHQKHRHYIWQSCGPTRLTWKDSFSTGLLSHMCRGSTGWPPRDTGMHVPHTYLLT